MRKSLLTNCKKGTLTGPFCNFAQSSVAAASSLKATAGRELMPT